MKGPIAVVVAGVVVGLLAAVATVVVGCTIETGSIGVVAVVVVAATSSINRDVVSIRSLKDHNQ